jgi:hypothetical protein
VRLPGRSAVDQLSLVQPVDRLGQRVVVAVSFAAHRRLDAGFAQAFAVPDGHVLGEFNPSTQHLLIGGVYEEQETEGGSRNASEDALARATAGAA